MSSVTTKRPENFKSKIPVPIFKNLSIGSEKEKVIGKKILSKPEISSKKSENCPPLLKENRKTLLVKPLSKKTFKKLESKNQPSFTQYSNKVFVENHVVSRKPKENIFSSKEKKSSNKAYKDVSAEILKKVTEKTTGKGGTKKAKPLEDQQYKSSNASLPTSDVRDNKIANKRVKNKNQLCTSENILIKKNQDEAISSDFAAQKGIKFEGNEIFRQMILRGRELSPSVCKLAPGVKLSSVIAHRPSAYDQVFEVHPDPFKHAMQAIEKMSAKRDYRKLSTQVEKMPLSPYRMRNSLYTPGVDPEKEVMKSLEAIGANRMLKSALKSEKKVTFNFNVEEFSAPVELTSEQISSANSEDKLTQISEGSSENTPSSPEKNLTVTDGDKKCLNCPKLESLNMNGKSTEQDDCHEHLISSQSDEDSEMNNLVEKYLNVLRPCANSLPRADSNKSPVSHSIKIRHASLYGDNNSKFVNEVFSCQKTIPQVLQKCTQQSKQRPAKMKLCTPRPVSFSSNSRLLHNLSPDFLEDRNFVNLSNLVPIYTPLVLKNMAKRSAESPDNLSPVKLKLDFAITENDTPKKESSGKMKVSLIKNIETASKKLDNLADKECDIFLSKENCNVLSARYLRNPVALTLTEGDEMHFVPIRL